MNKKLLAAVYALTAAVLYALNVPLSKLLLKNIEPVFMAAILYFGAGIGILLRLKVFRLMLTNYGFCYSGESSGFNIYFTCTFIRFCIVRTQHIHIR